MREETETLGLIIRRLAKGESVDQIFGVWRPANRPRDPEKEQRLYDMARMRLPIELGGEGLSYKETISRTAERFYKSHATVVSDYNSARGKEVREQVRQEGEFARSIGNAERWLGGITRE
jgi:hypothetical protein